MISGTLVWWTTMVRYMFINPAISASVDADSIAVMFLLIAAYSASANVAITPRAITTPQNNAEYAPPTNMLYVAHACGLYHAVTTFHIVRSPSKSTEEAITRP